MSQLDFSTCDMDLVAFGIVIDDLVFPDGKTVMGTLGGGGPQAAFGMRLWGSETGMVAGVGSDLPHQADECLSRSGIDRSGIRKTDIPTPRAWQVMEADGTRTQVWRVPGGVVGAQLGRAVEKIPPSYRHASGFHLGIHPEDPDLAFLDGLSRLGGVVSVEPFRSALRPLEPGLLHQLAVLVEVFSPTIQEAQSMMGQDDPLILSKSLISAGTRVVPLRMGAEGTMIIDGALGKAARIPAFPVKVVDPTGAGNAFCGGFLSGWVQTHDFIQAGLQGAAAASFLVETIGVPVVSAELAAEALRRIEYLRKKVTVSTV